LSEERESEEESERRRRRNHVSTAVAQCTLYTVQYFVLYVCTRYYVYYVQY